MQTDAVGARPSPPAFASLRRGRQSSPGDIQQGQVVRRAPRELHQPSSRRVNRDQGSRRKTEV